MIDTMWFTELFGTWGWLIALAIAVGINVPIFIWVRMRRHLTLFGSFLAGFFGITYWMMHPIFYAGLFTFFISSSVLTRYRRKEKLAVQEKFEKGGERDTSQVLANGLSGFIFAFGHLFTFLFTNNIILSNAFVFGFIASIATTNSDTWGTEIGILGNGQPYWILNLKTKVERGTSGGVSLKGTIAAFIGAIIVALVIFIIEIFWKNPITEISGWQIYLFLPIAAILGFVGSLIDSIMGATIQGFFECQVCGKGTEKRIHCKEHTKLIRGYENFRNDHVNFWASLIAGILAFGVSCFGFLIN